MEFVASHIYQLEERTQVEMENNNTIIACGKHRSYMEHVVDRI